MQAVVAGPLQGSQRPPPCDDSCRPWPSSLVRLDRSYRRRLCRFDTSQQLRYARRRMSFLRVLHHHICNVQYVLQTMSCDSHLCRFAADSCGGRGKSSRARATRHVHTHRIGHLAGGITDTQKRPTGQPAASRGRHVPPSTIVRRPGPYRRHPSDTHAHRPVRPPRGY